jgi:hypothetical protein
VKCGGGYPVEAGVLLDGVEVSAGCGGLILREELGLELRGAQAEHRGGGREGQCLPGPCCGSGQDKPAYLGRMADSQSLRDHASH